MKGSFVSIVAKILCFALLTQIFVLTWGGHPVQASSMLPDIHIQFGGGSTAAGDTPIPDYGEIYGERNGHTYGWNFDHTSFSVNEAVYGPSTLDSSIIVQPGGQWEIELPSGSYEVEVSVGNSVYGSMNTLRVEDVVFWDQLALPAGNYETAKNRVQVSDGRLSVAADPVSASTSIRSITIAKVVPVIRQMSLPNIGLPAVQNKQPGDTILLSGRQSNEHNAIPAIKVQGLGQAINTYLNAQLSSMEQLISTMEMQASTCTGCSAGDLESAIAGSPDEQIVMKTGHLNLDNSATFGSPDKPVFLIAEGINTNRDLTLTVYGVLAIKGNLNANTNLTMNILAPQSSGSSIRGDLWIGGTLHLNNDSAVEVSGDFMAGSLIYNNGQLNVRADRVLVSNQLHINTKVDMNVTQEMVVGNLVSNNQTANIRVNSGDLFIRDDIQVNNHLSLQTGGVVAIGGSLTANQKPLVSTGIGEDARTKLNYRIYGLNAEYYSEPDLTGDLSAVVDENVNLNNILPVSKPGLNDGNMSVRWTGTVTPYYSETYEFEMDVRGGVKLWVNGVLLIDKWEETGNGTFSGSLPLEAGEEYGIQIEYANRGGQQPRILLNWASESGAKEVVPQSQLSPFEVPVLTTVATENAINLEWTTSFNANGYEMEADGTLYPLGNQSSFAHTPLETGTLHRYRVRAVNNGIKGGWSPIQEVWTLPGIPANIRLESTSNSVTLTWDEVTGADGYDIETYNTVIDNGNSTTYTEIDLNPNLQRTFRIRARNSSGFGQWSIIVAKSTVPGATSSLYTVATDTSVSVSWDAVSGATSYDLEIDGTILEGIADTHYLHENLQPNTIHTYRVRSRNSEGSSGWSEAVQVITLPSVPRNLRSTAVSGDRISLEWDESTGAVFYELEINGVVVDVGTSTQYDHSGLESNTEHIFRIRARSESATGNWSEPITRTTLSGVPVNLRAVSTSTGITLSWEPVIGAIGYEVEADGQVITNGLNTTYTHSDLMPFTEHAYRVRAISQAGAGLWSDLLIATTGLDIPALNARALSKTSIVLSWLAVPGATAYDLMVDGEIIEVGNVTEFIHDGLLPYSWHAYRIRAKSGSLTGPWSAALTKATQVGTPVITGLHATFSEITVEWEAVAGATGYEIEADSAIVDVGAATSYIHRNLLPNTLHTYRVRAKSGDDAGDWSDWSELSTKATPPITPTRFGADTNTHHIQLHWDASPGALSYDLEVDGRIVRGITGTSYTHRDLVPNTMHVYRVRASNTGGISPWSNAIKPRTIPELTVDAGQGTTFNFVVVIPVQPGLTERTVTVTYNPDELEIQDLSAATPEIEVAVGPINGTNMIVSDIGEGRIVFRISNALKTTVNIIRFTAKTNEASLITYKVE
ncbi:fibronectin type III domain-containing protein [Cohnella cellulosilytica]|uniref:Fibronectin type III domain-containing protein n=1 Tax=Cohnella cellulosilytica TaxID=986710 RepID=A0ABW2FH34_9BACL